MVRRRLSVSVLQRVDTAATGLRLLSAARVFRVDYRVKLICTSLEEGGCDQLVDG